MYKSVLRAMIGDIDVESISRLSLELRSRRLEYCRDWHQPAICKVCYFFPRRRLHPLLQAGECMSRHAKAVNLRMMLHKYNDARLGLIDNTTFSCRIVSALGMLTYTVLEPFSYLYQGSRDVRGRKQTKPTRQSCTDKSDSWIFRGGSSIVPRADNTCSLRGLCWLIGTNYLLLRYHRYDAATRKVGWSLVFTTRGPRYDRVHLNFAMTVVLWGELCRRQKLKLLSSAVPRASQAQSWLTRNGVIQLHNRVHNIL